MWLEHLEHSHGAFEFNGALGTQWSTWDSWSMWQRNGSYEKGMNHMRREWISWQRYEYSKGGNEAPGSGIKHPGAWIRHIWSWCAILCLDAPLWNHDMPRSDMIWNQVTLYATKWHYMPKWKKMSRSDMIYHQVTWYAAKWLDMPPSDKVCHYRVLCVIQEEDVPLWSIMCHQGSWCSIMAPNAPLGCQVHQDSQDYPNVAKNNENAHIGCSTWLMFHLDGRYAIMYHHAQLWYMMHHNVFWLMLMRLKILEASTWHSVIGWKIGHPLNG